MGLFSKKKLYCVEWHSRWDIYHRDYITAKNESQAWQIIIKRQNHDTADYCDKIYEVISNKTEII